MKPALSLSSLLGLLAALGAASLSFAQQTEPRSGREHRERGDGARALFAVRQSEHNADAQEAPAGCGDCAMQPQRRERMTLEERRQLRHDINEAGRDLYHRHGQGWRP